jgi:hypothetical protein
MTIRQVGANSYNLQSASGTYVVLAGGANTKGVIIRTAVLECGYNGFARLLVGGVPVLGAGDGGNVQSATLHSPILVPPGQLIQWVNTSASNSTCFVSWDELP